jgi:hypothetical protein
MVVVNCAAARGPTVRRLVGGRGASKSPVVFHILSVIFCMYHVAILTVQFHEWVGLPNLFSHRTKKCDEPRVFRDKELLYRIVTVLNYCSIIFPQHVCPTETVYCTWQWNHGCVTNRGTYSTPIIHIITNGLGTLFISKPLMWQSEHCYIVGYDAV